MKNIISTINAKAIQDHEIEFVDLKCLFENLSELCASDLGRISSILQSWFSSHLDQSSNTISNDDKSALFFIGNLLRVLEGNRKLLSESYGAFEELQRLYLD